MATVLDFPTYEVIDEPAPARPVYPNEFVSWLQNEEERAKNNELNEERKVAISFYNRDPFGDEEEGRSQYVSGDVPEVIDYMVPSVLRTMVSGDRVVEFEALDSGFKDILEEATEAVSQQFMQEQSGWRILHDSLKAGLLEKTGAIKSFVEEKRTRREEDVTATQLAQMSAEGIEIVESEPIGQWAALPEEQRALIEASEAPEAIDQLGPIFRVAWFETSPRFVDIPLPNEEFGVAPDARSLDEAIYYNHRTIKTVSDINAMGLDGDAVATQGDAYTATTLSKTRDGVVSNTEVVRDGPNRAVWFLEEYCRYDLNGDGIAEFLRVQRVGTAILSVDEIEYGPCEEWCPFPMPHRRVGHSLADKTMDIQRVRSVIFRQTLDGMYGSNDPTTYIDESAIGDNTLDDLLNPTLRRKIVRYKGTAPVTRTNYFDPSAGQSMLEMLIGERESRTGITRLNQGLDADALNKTATGTALMQAQGQQIEEYIARNFAEFVGRVFEKKYRLMRDYGKPFAIIVDGQPRTVDPSKWPDEMRVMVRVGLGAGNKQQRIANRMLLLNLQKEAAQSGDENITAEHIFNSVKGLVADLQLGQPTDYYPDPATLPPPSDEPDVDPEVLKVQAEAQRKQQELEARIQEMQMKLQMQQAEAQAKAQRAQEEAQHRALLEQAKAQTKASQDQMRAEFEARLAEQKAQQEFVLAQMKLQMEAFLRSGQGNANLPDNRPGGSLAE